MKSFYSAKNDKSPPRELKPMKLSQKVVINGKDSYLTPTDSDHPASLKDENDKEGEFMDDFESLLYEEDGKN